MTPRIDEVATDLFRISLYVPQFDLQFNHFLIRDEEPLLFHTGLRGMFPGGPRRGGVADRPGKPPVDQLEPLRGGRMRRAQRVAGGRAATPLPVCGELGAMINIGDFANRPPRALKPDEILETGRHRFRFVPTPHLPHGWDAGVLFEEPTACCCARTCCTRSATSSR